MKKVEDCTEEAIARTLIRATDKAIPKKNPHKNPNHMNSWWNEDINLRRRKRQKARRKWKERRTEECRKDYNKCNAVLKKAVLTAKRRTWREFVGSINANTPSNTVWRKFRAIEGNTGKRIEQIKLPQGGWIDEDKEKADAFNKYYKKRAGGKIPWPKPLTTEEMQLLSLIHI